MSSRAYARFALVLFGITSAVACSDSDDGKFVGDPKVRPVSGGASGGGSGGGGAGGEAMVPVPTVRGDCEASIEIAGALTAVVSYTDYECSASIINGEVTAIFNDLGEFEEKQGRPTVRFLLKEALSQAQPGDTLSDVPIQVFLVQVEGVFFSDLDSEWLTPEGACTADITNIGEINDDREGVLLTFEGRGQCEGEALASAGNSSDASVTIVGEFSFIGEAEVR